MTTDATEISGTLHVVLTGPDGEVKLDETVPNLITQVGEQTYGERGAGLAGAPAAPASMQLGTGTTAPAKTGTGDVIVTYVAGSSASSGTAVSSLSSGKRRLTYTSTWAAGTATATGIAEVVLTNQAAATQTAAPEANTIARALLSPTINKGAADSLTITWNHDIGS